MSDHIHFFAVTLSCLNKFSYKLTEIFPLRVLKVRGGLVVKVSSSHPKDHGFKPHLGHNHVSL